MNAQQDVDRAFLLDLERAAKGLSIGGDGPAAARLRHLFREVERNFPSEKALPEPLDGAK